MRSLSSILILSLLSVGLMSCGKESKAPTDEVVEPANPVQPSGDEPVDNVIFFADPDVKAALVAHFDIDGDAEISMVEAEAVTWNDIAAIVGEKGETVSGLWGKDLSAVNTFDELKYFTGLTNGTSYRLPPIFRGCSSLKSVVLPDNLEMIDNFAFQGCTSLDTVVLPPFLKKIYSSAFEASGLKRIFIPGTVTNMSNNVFQDCASLVAVDFPEEPALKTIGKNVFRNCISLANFNMPGSNVLESIGDYAFSGCGKMKLASRNYKSLNTISPYAFENCSRIQNLTISASGLKTIGRNAFYRCRSLVNVMISEDIEQIDQFAFSGCTSLTGISYIKTGESGINLPEGLISIGKAAFGGCAGIKDVFFPSTITSIGANVFRSESFDAEYAVNLDSWTILAVQAPSLGEDPFLKKNNEGSVASILVPIESVQAYKAADVWKNYAGIIVANNHSSVDLTLYGSTIDIRTWGLTSERHMYIFPFGSAGFRKTFSDLSDNDRVAFSGITYAASHWDVHGIESVSASGECNIKIATPLDLSGYSEWESAGESFNLTNGVVYNCYRYSYSEQQAATHSRVVIPHHETWSTIVFSSGGNMIVDAPPPPCIIIDKSTKLRNVCVNNPAITILPDGSYIASQTSSYKLGYVYKSVDNGDNWTQISDKIRSNYCSIYHHEGTMYMMGCDAVQGSISIQKSTDGGYNWGEVCVLFPKTEDGYHGSSSPCVEKNGRVYRAMSECGNGTWGVFLLSAPIGADLTKTTSWTMSNIVYYNTSWLQVASTYWQEPALVQRPDGSMCIIMRIDGTSNSNEYAAMLEVDSDTSIRFSRTFRMPGAAKRMTIAYDPQSGKYWSLVSPYYDSLRSLYGLTPSKTRNSMVLISSPDLINWTRERTCIYSDNAYNNSYHYIDWRFDGDDLVSVFRCSFQEDRGLPLNYHDSNGFGFFRVRNFRNGNAVSTIFVDTPVVSGAPSIPSLL